MARRTRKKQPDSIVYSAPPPPLDNDQASSDDLELHQWIETMRNRILPDAPRVKIFRAYARGRQRVTLTAKQKEMLRKLLGNRFCDNLIKKALVILTSRLRLSRWLVDGDEGGSAIERLQAIMTTRNLRDLNQRLTWAMLRDADAAVSIGWRVDPATGEGYVTLSRELFWDGETGVAIFYGPDGSIASAVKDWRLHDNSLRRDVYYHDQIRRYFKPAPDQGFAAPGPYGWRIYNEPTDPMAEFRSEDGLLYQNFVWPVPWVTPEGQPIGVPFVHFPNPAMPNDGDTDDVADRDDRTVTGACQHDPRMGVSELDSGLIGIQDHLNDVHYDLAVARKFTAFQQYWSAGGTDDDDEDDDGDPETQARIAMPGAWHEFDDPASEAGVLPAGDLTPIISVIDVDLQAFSRNSEIPVFAFNGNWPSGEAIYQSQAGLSAKVEMITDTIASRWGEVGWWILYMENLFGGASHNLGVPIGMEFDDVGRLDPFTLAAIARARAPYVSRREVLRLLGYSEAQMNTIEAELEAEADTKLKQEQSLAEAALARFNRDPTVPPAQ